MPVLKRGDWFRLQAGNDWGAVYYARAPLEMRPCTVLENGVEREGSYGTASSRRAYCLKFGETLEVRLRNGTVLSGTVVSRTEHRTVSDHGHSYSFVDEVPELEFTNGLRAKMTDVEFRYDPERDPTASELE